MLKDGRIPNPLATIINEMVAKKGQANIRADEMAPAELYEMLKLVDDVVSRAVLEPLVAVAPQKYLLEPDEDGSPKLNPERLEWVCPEGHLPTDEITWEDRLFIFGVALGGATDLETFRAQQASAMAVVSDVSDVPVQAQPTPVRPGPLPGVVSR